MINRITRLLVTFCLLSILALAACKKNEPTIVDPCTSFSSSWKMNDTSYKAGYVGQIHTYNSSYRSFSLTMDACIPNSTQANDFNIFVGHDIAVGTYALSASSHSLGALGAEYHIGSDTFRTDNLHTGSITIASVHDTTYKYQATFQFDAMNKAGAVIHDTNGILTLADQ